MPKSLPTSEPDSLARIAKAQEDMADALTMLAKLAAEWFERVYPIISHKNPVTVFSAKYKEKQEEFGIPLEDEIELDTKTGKAKIKSRSYAARS